MLNLKTPPAQPLISASILSADFGFMMQECRDVLDQGADLLHLDIMDGHFVPNITMGQDMCRAVRKHFPDVYLDVHLMVQHPQRFFEQFAKAGASLLTFHAEVCPPLWPAGPDPRALLDEIHKLGMDAGMVINPGTAPQVLEPYLDQMDLVLVMSVVPGKSGQKFMPEALPKAQWLRSRLRPQTRLEMDGGVSPQTVGQVVDSGVDVLVTASALFGATDRGQVIRQLHAGGK